LQTYLQSDDEKTKDTGEQSETEASLLGPLFRIIFHEADEML